MTQYRYLFADLLTNEVIGELPLTGVNFTQQLNSIGAFDGHLLLSGVNAYALNVDACTTPARTAIYVDRDGVLVWGGVIWGRQYNSITQTLMLKAQEFESYFQHRVVSSTQTYAGTDQLTIAQGLVNTAQAVPNGNIGVLVGAETCGVVRDAIFYGYELKNVYQALLDLSRSDNGFDFRIVVAYNGGYAPSKTLQLGYPRSGTVYSDTDPSALVFEFPAGNIVEYEYPEDGTTAANTVYAVGAGSNEGKLITSASDPAKLAAGWPVMETYSNYTDYTDVTLLADLAAGQVAAVSTPPTTVKIVVPPYVDPVLGSYGIGDDCRLRITDDRFPTGLNAIYRVVALNVTPGEDGPERATLTLTIPAV